MVLASVISFSAISAHRIVVVIAASVPASKPFVLVVVVIGVIWSSSLLWS